MKVLYARVSTQKQSLDRQLHNTDTYGMVIEDKGISGSIPFFKRPYANKIASLLESGKLTELHTHSIDRLGRNLKDILNTIDVFAEYRVPIYITSQGIRTYDVDKGDINPTTKLLLQVMGSVAEMEKNLTKERIKHSLDIKKLNGELLGRRVGTTEPVSKFLNKDKSKKIHRLLNKGFSIRHIASIVGCGTQLIIKVKKLTSN
jgi:DNA invertase Pin-like site-specific DNA recombinase